MNLLRCLPAAALLLVYSTSAHAQFRNTREAVKPMVDSVSIVHSTDSLNHTEFLRNNVAFGATFGTPGGLNFVAEGYYDRLGLRMEAGVFPFLFGMESDVT